MLWHNAPITTTIAEIHALLFLLVNCQRVKDPHQDGAITAEQAHEKHKVEEEETDDFYDALVINGLYVDKSLLIRELLSNGANVTVITQPSGYGKTLNMMMLKRFLNIETDSKGDAVSFENRTNRKLFVGGELIIPGDGNGDCKLLSPLQICRDENSMRYQGEYPVVWLSFRNVGGENYRDVINQMNDRIRTVINEYGYNNGGFEKNGYLQRNLADLSKFLNARYDRKVFILLDEYDTPILNFYIRFSTVTDSDDDRTKDLEKLLEFYREFISKTFLTNRYLEKGIVTGIMPIGKRIVGFSSEDDDNCENNVTNTGNSSSSSDCYYNSVLYSTVFDETYYRYYSFSKREVIELLRKALIQNPEVETIKKWHVGYNFHNDEDVYIPRSTVRYARDCKNGGTSGSHRWSLEENDKRQKWFIQRILRSERALEVLQLLASGRQVAFTLQTEMNDLRLATGDHRNDHNAIACLRKDNFVNILVYAGYVFPRTKVSWHVSTSNANIRFILRASILRCVCDLVNVTETEFYKLVELLTDHRAEQFKQRLPNVIAGLKIANETDNIDINTVVMVAPVSGPEPIISRRTKIFYRGFMISLTHALYPIHILANKRYLGEEKVTAVLFPNSNRADNALLLKYRIVDRQDQLESTSKAEMNVINGKSYNRKTSKHPCVKRFLKICLAFHKERVAVQYTEEDFRQ